MFFSLRLNTDHKGTAKSTTLQTEKILQSHFDCLIAGDSEPFHLSGDKVSLGRKAPGMSLTCCRCFVKFGSHLVNFVSNATNMASEFLL